MASWEIDVWGRIARMVEGAKATLESSVEDLRGVLISIRSQVGTTYMNVRTLQLQLSILRSAVKNYKTTLDLVKDKFKAGTNTLLDVNQAQTDLDVIAATIPAIEGDLDAAIFSLAQLCGTTSGPMTMLLGEPAPLPQMNEEIGIGIPAELLRRRPDVRSSERLVAAAVANIGAQEALNLPIFSLSGNFYLASNQFTGLGDSNNASYGFGPSISWLIFQGGYVNSMIAQSKGQAQVALAGYRDTVLGAMRDVETSISLLVHAKRSEALYTTAEKSAQETYKLANLQYKAGRTNLDTLIRVQNELLNTQKQLADSQGSVAQNTVSLYRALGGGWEDGAVNRAAERSAAMKDPS
jgi:NodT family efflux transporter outer membrane factor (OMF) lipoprotein